jgi:hypothetical protein
MFDPREKITMKADERDREASETHCPFPATIIIIEFDTLHEFNDEETIA